MLSTLLSPTAEVIVNIPHQIHVGDSLWAIATAFGTILLAVAALGTILWDPLIKVFFYKPVLDIDVHCGPPDCHRTTIGKVTNFRAGSDPSIYCYYFRFVVSNNGNIPAKNVEVFVNSLMQRQADQSFVTVNDFLPLNLKWSHIGGIYFPIIAKKMKRHCDLGHIIKPDKRRFLTNANEDRFNSDQTKTLFSFDLIVQPNTLSHLIEPGIYRIEIYVSAENAEPKHKYFDLEFNGKWSDNQQEMLRDNIEIKPSSS